MFTYTLAQIINYCIAHNKPFAVWRLPSSTEKHLIFSNSDILTTDIEVIKNKRGFKIQPFIENSALIEAEFHTIFFDNSEIKFPHPIGEPLPYPTHTSEISNSSEKEYCQLVEKGIKAINENTLKKVVLSRKKTIAKSVEPASLFQKIDNKYPTAFVNIHYTPIYGLWMGASPEILVEVSNKILKSVALAGTQIANEEITLKNAVWNQKEIEEQALVSRYIINCFKKIRLREFEEDGPKTVQAGNLLHLKTDFWVNLEAINYPELADTLTQLFHPTSAVGGMPREEAIKFILENENYNRNLYAGYIGPQNIETCGDCNFYVNIRCLQWANNQLSLFAGAGITSDSVPEKEFEETQNKMNTLQEVIER